MLRGVAMTAKLMINEAQGLLDKDQRALWVVNGLEILVQAEDMRQVWNRVDYLITPVQGYGEVWVAAASLKQVR